MTASLDTQIAKARQTIARAENYAWSQRGNAPLRERLKAYADAQRRRLAGLMLQLDARERVRQERIAEISRAAYMTKLVAGHVEVYDRRHAFVGAVDGDDEPTLAAMLADAGKRVEGVWPDYRGGKGHTPGLALWWRGEQD